LRGAFAINQDHAEALAGQSLRHERAGYACADNQNLAAEIIDDGRRGE
jgi:hypothetical protein